MNSRSVAAVAIVAFVVLVVLVGLLLRSRQEVRRDVRPDPPPNWGTWAPNVSMERLRPAIAIEESSEPLGGPSGRSPR